jgi:choline-sulfatase
MARGSRTITAFALVLGAAAVTWLLTRAHTPGDLRPNVLLVTFDTLRADHASCCGYLRATTPRLDRLATEGTLFCHAYCTVPACAPSHASILTGQYAAAHGLVKNGDVLQRGRATLAKRLQAVGYATAAVVSSFLLSARFGLNSGFDLYDDELPPQYSSYPVSSYGGLTFSGGFDRRADAATARAITWLVRERPRRRPFFLWVHLFDAHAPYNAPPPHDRLFTSSTGMPTDAWSVPAYDGELHFADESLGQLLDALDADGLAARTIVVVVSDHGEGLGQHDVERHGTQLYEEAVRVPVVLSWPGHIRAGQSLTAPISLVDLAPTLLDLAAVPAQPPAMAGRSLARVLRGEEQPDAERPLFLRGGSDAAAEKQGSTADGSRYGVRLGSYKLIATPGSGTPELYDLATDPDERHNVAAEQADRASRLAAMLEEWVRSGPMASQERRPSQDDRRDPTAARCPHD